MLKTLVIILTLFSILSLLSSRYTEEDDTTSAEKAITVLYTDGCRDVVRDNSTNIMYMGGYGKSICVMVDTDGKPLTYDKWKNSTN